MLAKRTSVTLTLPECLKGQTKQLGGIYFVEGLATLHGSPQVLEKQMRYLWINWQVTEVEYGTSEVPQTSKSGKSTEVPSDLLANSEGSSSETITNLGQSGDSHEDTYRSDSSRGGHGYTREVQAGTETSSVGQNAKAIDYIKLKQLLETLDHKDDESWTQLGLPKLVKLCQLYGSEDITRKDVQSVCPDLVRKG